MKEKRSNKNVAGSFRDPSGFLFYEGGTLYRQVNHPYKKNFDHLVNSGLFKKLVKEGLFVPFREASLSLARTKEAYKVIKPAPVPFVSYPYEWSFSQLKDAALATLKIQKMALEEGMVLKDASAYNIQFISGKPFFIDTLSFEIYKERPWVAYRQFCQHFLAPLALMDYVDVRLSRLLRVYIDGIPLDLAVKLLPQRAMLRPQLLAHLYLHAKSQEVFAARSRGLGAEKGLGLKKGQMMRLVDGLESAVSGLRWEPKGTEWAEYYDETNYSKSAFDHKKKVVEDFLRYAKPKIVWDLGANTGVFSRLASKWGALTVAFDIDRPWSRGIIVKLWRMEKKIFFLWFWISPTQAEGWDGLTGRGCRFWTVVLRTWRCLWRLFTTWRLGITCRFG